MSDREQGDTIPNAETLAAMAETDEMIRTGGGEHFTGTTADFFAILDGFPLYAPTASGKILQT